MHEIEKQQPDIVMDDMPITAPGADKDHLNQRVRQFLVVREANGKCPQSR